MGVPIFVARLRITNGDGVFDSLSSGRTQPRIIFDVRQSLAASPNSAAISIYNLAPDTIAKITGVVRTRVDWTPAERAQLLEAGASAEPIETIGDGFGFVAVELSWGYTDSERYDPETALRVGFVGQSSRPRVVRDGTDRVLVLECTDAGNLLGAGSVLQRAGGGPAAYRSKSYAPGSSAVDVIMDLVYAMGLSTDRATLEQQLTSALLARGLPPGDLFLSGGYTSSGPAQPLLEGFLRSLDLRWSVQNGELLLLSQSSVIPGLAPLLLSTERRNIIGEPERLEGTRLGVSTFALADIRPGRQVDVLAGDINASFRADEVSTRGDTSSGAQADLRLDELQIIPGVL
jgi:hypothetical protein